jgi:hypothetical protein
MLTTSHRWLPWRSILAISAVGATAAAVGPATALAGVPGRAAAALEAVTVCGRSGTVKRSSRGNCDRSGGTSSGVERVFAA